MIYWDNNATTPLDPEVYAAMEPFLKERFFNPSAGYGCARSVREAVEEARADVAALLGAFPSEIVFTSGGTEATNMAFRQRAGARVKVRHGECAGDHRIWSRGARGIKAFGGGRRKAGPAAGFL